MQHLQWIFLLTLLRCLKANDIFWQTYAPGQLLHSLNQLIANVDAQPMQPKAKVQATAHYLQKRADMDAASSEYDYDRAYEQFVRKYFSNAADKAFSDEQMESQEQDAVGEGSRKQQSKQYCKKVRRNREQCEICRNAKTNEKSETCSYASDATPLKYDYEQARNYKTLRHTDSDSDEEQDAYETGSVDSEEEEEQQNKSKSGSCTRRQHGKKVCYTCINSDGKITKECSKMASTRKRRGDAQNEHKSEKTQRIYKRTVSYSYMNNNGTDDKSAEFKS